MKQFKVYSHFDESTDCHYGTR